MAVAYRSAVVQFGIAATPTFTRPEGVVAGDLLVAMFMSETTITAAAAGWTAQTERAGSYGSMMILTKPAGASEPTSYTFSVLTKGPDTVGILAAYSGVQRIRFAQASNVAAAATVLPFPAPPELIDNDLVVRVAAAFPITPSTTTSSIGSGGRIRFSTFELNNPTHPWLLDEPFATDRSLALTGGKGAITTATLVFGVEHRPNAPLLQSPGSQETINRNNINRFVWQHSDEDLDGQFSAELRYRVVGATTWTTVETSGPNQFLDFGAGTFAAAPYEWQVRTSDHAADGPYSASGFFTAANPPAGPTITAPINGQTVSEPSVVVKWTGTGSAFQVRSLADNAGVADTATVYYDSGTQVTGTRAWTVPLPVNSRFEHLQVREATSGLWGPYSSVRVLVSYTPPAKALGSLTSVQTVPSAYRFNDALALKMVTPTPTNGQPTPAYLNVHVEALDDGDQHRPVGLLVRIAAQLQAGVFTDHRVASGVRYGYRIETIAVNGTTSMSDLIVDDTGFPPQPPVEDNDPVEPTVTTVV